MAPSPYDAELSALEAARRPLGLAETGVREAGEKVDTASSTAGGAAGDGPLAGALATFGEETKTQAQERSDAVRQLGQDLGQAAEGYRADDAAAQANLDRVMRPGG